MASLGEVREAIDAITAFYKGAKGEPALPVRLLQPVFDRLTVETRLFLARDVTTGMLAASLEAKKRWGDEGNVCIDGNLIRVGTYSGGTFIEKGRGYTWKAAFLEADRRGGFRDRIRDLVGEIVADVGDIGHTEDVDVDGHDHEDQEGSS